MQRISFIRVLAAVALAAACGDTGDQAEFQIEATTDSGAVPVQQAEDAAGSMPPARDPRRPAGSLGTAAEATQVAATLSEFAIDVSPDTIPPGETTVNIENRGERRHIIEVRHATRGRWRATPIPPGASVSLSMPLPSGVFEIVSTDENYVNRGMRATLVVR
jgi:hypothetical protein